MIAIADVHHFNNRIGQVWLNIDRCCVDFIIEIDIMSSDMISRYPFRTYRALRSLSNGYAIFSVVYDYGEWNSWESRRDMRRIV